jgi:hypothetical protein
VVQKGWNLELTAILPRGLVLLTMEKEPSLTETVGDTLFL